MDDSRSGRLTRREVIGLLGVTVGSIAGAAVASASPAPQGRGGGRGGGQGGGGGRTPSKEWLDQVVEAPIETEIPIIDPHHHMSWTPGASRYNLEDILADTKGNNIRQTVAVIGPNVVEWVNGLASEAASGVHGETHVAAGIVGGGDLMQGDAAAAELEKQMADSRRFRGMRHAVGWTNPPVRAQNTKEHMLLDPQFLKGIAQLQRLGLSFEAWLYYNQLHDVAELAHRFPDLPIILNHIGGILGVGAWDGKIEEVYQAWKPAIAEVAKYPNVTVKVGGLGMNYLNGFGWDKRPKPATSDELVEKNRRWWDYTIQVFTPQRCMFQSNFPPDKESSSYTVVWNHFKKYSKSYTKAERAAMFHDTAMRVYRLARV
jgi:predicted TIM-barrel fold metal-dependent hydrolase